METIYIDFVVHKREPLILLRFPFDRSIFRLLKTIPGMAWSKTLNAMFIQYTADICVRLRDQLKEMVNLDFTEFEKHWEEWKASGAAERTASLSAATMIRVMQFRDWMRTKRYSENTVNTYVDALTTFLKFHRDKNLAEISNEDLIQFDGEYILKNRYSSSFQNQVINAVKLFFVQIEKRKFDVTLIMRPRREKLLPNVLSKEEVRKILDGGRNLKHKAMLSLIYSCGLRSGELINLRPADIDANRMVIIIRMAKGKKDRIAPLSPKILELLRTYYKAYLPKIFLFEGVKAGEPYDARSLQQVLKQHVERAKIRKPVTLHWLRHSYATHLLESGTDLRYIQEILGHSSSKTTEIYTHVSTRSIQQIISPFDTL